MFRLKAANPNLLAQLESNRAIATAESQKLLAENSQLLAALQLEQGRQESLKTRMRSPRRKNLLLVAAQAGKQLAEKAPRQMRGGSSNGVKIKFSCSSGQLPFDKVCTTTGARQQALLEHYRTHPESFSFVVNKVISKEGFDNLCNLNPDWVVPYQNEIVEEIQRF